MSLDIQHIHVKVDNKEIVKNLTLQILPGEVHALMGPNGSGKSTFANSLMGHPKYELSKGTVTLDGVDITRLPTDERAKAGLFLSMQYPPEIAGVTISNFLRVARESLTGEKQHPVEFYRFLQDKMKEIGIDSIFAKRYLNQGFSGGEKKRAEILQMAVLDPKYAVLDETDSGLDVDALRIVAEGINTFRGDGKGILIITHYKRILEYITPDVVHIMIGGTIVTAGGPTLAHEVEVNGYDQFLPYERKNH